MPKKVGKKVPKAHTESLKKLIKTPPKKAAPKKKKAK